MKKKKNKPAKPGNALICSKLFKTFPKQTLSHRAQETLNPKAALAPASQALERVPDTPMVSVKMN